MPTKSWKNHLKKLLTYGSWELFFSAAPTAQNSSELHFRFLSSFIQPSRVGYLFRIHYYLFEMYCKFISQPKQYLNDPYCQEMCLDMHAKYDCVSSVQKWIGEMMDKKNSLGRSCHLSTTWHSRNSFVWRVFFFVSDFFLYHTT